MKETIKKTKEFFEAIKNSEQAKEEAKKVGKIFVIVTLIELAAVKYYLHNS